MKEQGKSIIMSTHMMHQVETMAARMLMINRGRKVLYGAVDDIRQQYADHAVYIGGAGNWETLPFAERVSFDEDERANLVMLRQGVTSDDALRMIAQQPDMHVDRFEVALPSLDDIFITVVEGHRKTNGHHANGKVGER